MKRLVLASLLISFATACIDDPTAELTDAELAELESDATVPTPVTGVTDGQFVTISGAAGSSRYFKIVVPDGFDHVTAYRSVSWNSDVYIKRGALPSTTSYDCRRLGTENGSCTIDYPAAGTYYVLVRGAGGSGYNNVIFDIDVWNTYQPVGNTVPQSIYNQYGYDVFYKLDVPAGTARASFTFTLDPSSHGSLDLGVSHGHFTTEGYHCWRNIGFYESIPTATCAWVNPTADTYYIALRGHLSKYVGTFTAGYQWPLPTNAPN